MPEYFGESVPPRAPVRVHFGASEQLKSTLELLVRPDQRRRFGAQTLRLVAREAMFDLGPSHDTFLPAQEFAYSQYMRRVESLKGRQFPLWSRADFGKDKSGALYVRLWPALNTDDQERIVAPPLYKAGSDETLSVTARLSAQLLLPADKLVRGSAEVRQLLGQGSTNRARGRLAIRSLFIDDLQVSRMPRVVPPVKPAVSSK